MDAPAGGCVSETRQAQKGKYPMASLLCQVKNMVKVHGMTRGVRDVGRLTDGHCMITMSVQEVRGFILEQGEGRYC